MSSPAHWSTYLQLSSVPQHQQGRFHLTRHGGARGENGGRRVQASNLQATGDEATDSSAAAALGHCCVRGCLICDKKRVPHLHLPHVHISLHAFTPHMRDIMSKDVNEVKKSAHLVRGMNQRAHACQGRLHALA